MNLFEKLNKLDDSLVESKRIVKKKKLTESTEQYELSTLVRDSINHLVNDLGKDPMSDDFSDDVCADLENNYEIDVPQEPVRYANWCYAVMSEVSRQLNNKEEQLTEDLEYEFKPTELQKAKAEVLKLNAAQRFKKDETLPEIFALYKEFCSTSEDGKANVSTYGYGTISRNSSPYTSQAEDFLNFYKTVQELKNRREIEIDHNLDKEKRDSITGAATVKFKSQKAKDKLFSDSTD